MNTTQSLLSVYGHIGKPNNDWKAKLFTRSFTEGCSSGQCSKYRKKQWKGLAITHNLSLPCIKRFLQSSKMKRKQIKVKIYLKAVKMKHFYDTQFQYQKWQQVKVLYCEANLLLLTTVFSFIFISELHVNLILL